MTGAADAGGDRADLHLRPEDVELVRAVAAANPRTVVAVVAAGTVLMEEWQDQVPAILLTWYSGMEGGAALADVLLGSVDAGGRLPFCVPTSAEHLPEFDRDATSVTYDRWFGQRRLEHLGVAPAYPLGFGLSYTTFTVEALDAVRDGEESIAVRVRVRNTGERDGRHVVQVYGRAADGERFLLGFAPVAVGAGQTMDVEVPASVRPLGRWVAERREIRVRQGPYRLEVGSFWGDPEAMTIEA
jgi:beta-glucosidase